MSIEELLQARGAPGPGPTAQKNHATHPTVNHDGHHGGSTRKGTPSRVRRTNLFHNFFFSFYLVAKTMLIITTKKNNGHIGYGTTMIWCCIWLQYHDALPRTSGHLQSLPCHSGIFLLLLLGDLLHQSHQSCNLTCRRSPGVGWEVDGPAHGIKDDELIDSCVCVPIIPDQYGPSYQRGESVALVSVVPKPPPQRPPLRPPVLVGHSMLRGQQQQSRLDFSHT